MKKPCDEDSFDSLRDKIIGLGEKSLRKSYYPELKQRVTELEEANARLKREIQEREQAEEELRKSKADLEKAQALANMGNWSWDIVSDHLRGSSQIYRILGIEKEECPSNLRQLIARFVHPDDLVAFEKAAVGAIREKNFDPVECRIIRPDGEVRVTRTEAGELLLDEAGNPTVLNGITHDITRYRQAEEALRQSEERFQSLFNRVQDGVYRSTPDGRFVEFNQALMQILGYESREELQNLDIRRDLYYQPEDRDASLVDSGLEPIETYRLRHKDGREIWVEDHGHYVYDVDGKILFHEGILRDITERKRTEEALRESRRFLADLIENSGTLISVKDCEGRFEMVNRKWEEVTGLVRQEVLGHRDLELYPKFIADQFRRNDLEAMETGKIVEKEEVLENERGRSYLLSIKFPIRGNDNKIRGICGMSTEITDRKRAEETLRESEEMYRALIQALPDIVIRFDRQGRHLFISENAAAEFGLSAQEHVGKTFAELGFPESSSRFCEEKILQVFESGVPCEVELQLERSGHKRFLNWRLVPERDAQGRICSVLSVSRDVTDIHQNEEERKRLQEQLAQAQKMESVGRLAGGVAHDFNNMLAAILGHAEMALERVAPDHPLSADLRGIQNAAQRSADLTRQLLAFARKQTVMPKVLNLNDTVGGMLKMLGRLIGEDLQLAWLPGKNLWPVKMDPSQIDQVLANLCVNARDAIGKTGGRITIETGNVVFDETYCGCHADTAPGEYVLLAVSDNGCGMDRQTQEHLFEPFFTTKGIGQGTGLGLATVYGVVKQNNGSINVYSEPGNGTTFKLYWPRYAGKLDSHLAEPAGALDGGRETVLMVEDEPAILVMCRAMVEKLGYRVITAGTPGEAIRLAQEHAGQIHLLMTDVVMPEMNGRDLARRILSLYPDLKCLFMSGYTANVIAHHGVLDEGVQFLQKPFTLKDLSARIRTALDSEQGDKPGK
jgi:PAS domain S-box-containing protein